MIELEQIVASQKETLNEMHEDLEEAELNLVNLSAAFRKSKKLNEELEPTLAKKEKQVHALIQQTDILEHRNKILIKKSQLLEEQNHDLEELLLKVKLTDNEVNFRVNFH